MWNRNFNLPFNTLFNHITVWGLFSKIWISQEPGAAMGKICVIQSFKQITRNLKEQNEIVTIVGRLTNKKLPEIHQSIKSGKATLRRQQKLHVQYYGHTWMNGKIRQQKKVSSGLEGGHLKELNKAANNKNQN